MKLNIHGEKIDVTDSIKDYITEKISKLDKYLKNSDNYTANIKIKTKNLNQTIEVTIVTKDFTLRAEETTQNLYDSINTVISKLERQIRKNKTKLQHRYTNIIDYNNIELESEEENQSKIMKRKNIDSKPMDEEEAILQLELLNHDFFIFKNVKEDCISVVYKRKDDNYGIINLQ